MSERPRTWADLERIAGIKRTVPPSVTQRDVERLTRKHLGRRFWKRWR